jgi:hypothetical protein
MSESYERPSLGNVAAGIPAGLRTAGQRAC